MHRGTGRHRRTTKRHGAVSRGRADDRRPAPARERARRSYRGRQEDIGTSTILLGVAIGALILGVAYAFLGSSKKSLPSERSGTNAKVDHIDPERTSRPEVKAPAPAERYSLRFDYDLSISIDLQDPYLVTSDGDLERIRQELLSLNEQHRPIPEGIASLEKQADQLELEGKLLQSKSRLANAGGDFDDALIFNEQAGNKYKLAQAAILQQTDMAARGVKIYEQMKSSYSEANRIASSKGGIRAASSGRSWFEFRDLQAGKYFLVVSTGERSQRVLGWVLPVDVPKSAQMTLTDFNSVPSR